MKTQTGALLAELVASLRQEGEALVSGDADRVAQLAERKSDLLQRLAPLATSGAAGLSRALLDEARALNDRNAVLLAPRLLATRARVDALLQAGNPTVYGADGRTRPLAARFTRA